MIRNIVEINEEKCTGCGLCVEACHEGAIVLVDGKAKLIKDDYCDGLGACLPACPADAIRIVQREAAAFDEQAVAERQANEAKAVPAGEAAPSPSPCPTSCQCPGTAARALKKAPAAEEYAAPGPGVSRLGQWPVQIKLAPLQADYFDGAHLLVAADCTAYAYANFHERLMKNKVTLIGCPKLDEGDYTQKLTEIMRRNAIRSLTVARMDVPCCGGLEHAAVQALQHSGKFIPWRVVAITTNGDLIEE